MGHPLVPLVPTLCVGTQFSTLCVTHTYRRAAQAIVPTQSVGTRMNREFNSVA